MIRCDRCRKELVDETETMPRPLVFDLLPLNFDEDGSACKCQSDHCHSHFCADCFDLVKEAIEDAYQEACKNGQATKSPA